MNDKFQDICLTCNNSRDCIQLVDNQQPVLHCELFDDYIPEPAIIEINTYESKTNKNDIGCGIGLCQNCEKNNDCIYTNTEGGIWQCEEYL
ncbi:MAG: hypothetical protein HQ509_04740 [Candidatus Marinimicrobia bacterium]|nr:hypothetical protein [Candidatus Neomarinimicrobiota bacterium]